MIGGRSSSPSIRAMRRRSAATARTTGTDSMPSSSGFGAWATVSGSTSSTALNGVTPSARASRVGIPHRLHQVAEAPADHRVLDDGDPPRLAVATARRVAGVVEQLVDRGVGYRLVGERADGSGRPQRGDDVHQPSPATSCLLATVANDVQGRASLEPLDLLGAERVRRLEVDGRPVGLDDLAPHRLSGHRRQPEHVDAVVLADLVVGRRVGERQRHESLLLGVGLVDAGEAAGEDDDATAEPRLHRRVLARRALAVVAVADGAPADALLAVTLGDLRERAGLAVGDVLALARPAREGVDDTEEEVAGDVLQVPAVLQPRSGRRDVVGRALALRLHEQREVAVVLAVPRRERLEQLQTVAGRADRDRRHPNRPPAAP